MYSIQLKDLLNLKQLVRIDSIIIHHGSFFFFFLIWVLRPFQEYFTYIEPIVHRRWAKTGEPGEKPPDHP